MLPLLEPRLPLFYRRRVDRASEPIVCKIGVGPKTLLPSRGVFLSLSVANPGSQVEPAGGFVRHLVVCSHQPSTTGRPCSKPPSYPEHRFAPDHGGTRVMGCWRSGRRRNSGAQPMRQSPGAARARQEAGRAAQARRDRAPRRLEPLVVEGGVRIESTSPPSTCRAVNTAR